MKAHQERMIKKEDTLVLTLDLGAACTERIMKRNKTTSVRTSNIAIFLLMSLAMIALAPTANNPSGSSSPSQSSPESILRRTTVDGNNKATASTKPPQKSIQKERKPLGTPPPYSPFHLPIAGELNAPMAAALIHQLPHDATIVTWNTKEPINVDANKLWSMFARKSWTRRPDGMKGCFSEANFWENLKDTDKCDRNWYRGGFAVGHEFNKKDWRADYNGNQINPALLGFEEDLQPFNCREIESKTGKPANCEEQGLIESAFEAGNNLLRLDARFGWNMCRNLEWVTCAIRGSLPNQGTGKIRFATTTKLDVLNFLFRDGGCDGDCESGYSVADVFFAEVTFISYLCKNREELFGLEIGDEFDCDFDMEALDRLAEAASQSTGGRGSPDFWTRPE